MTLKKKNSTISTLDIDIVMYIFQIQNLELVEAWRSVLNSVLTCLKE